jgi:cyanate lyase
LSSFAFCIRAWISSGISNGTLRLLVGPRCRRPNPLIYRFYELVLVNGPAWKALIEEEFGDGIMSAIDFDMEITRLPDPKGDRARIGMTGKFLPFKYYGATGQRPGVWL